MYWPFVYRCWYHWTLFSHHCVHVMGKKIVFVRRAHIVTLHGEGYTNRDTSVKLCCLKTAVYVVIVKLSADGTFYDRKRKEGNVLFNDAINTFYLRLYGIGHMVKDHSDSERGNPLPPHGLLFPINSKGSFICTIPQTG